jgi:alanyl-tRNA synthetase
MTGGAAGGLEQMLSAARDVSGARVLGVKSTVGDRAALRELAEQLRDRLGDAVVLVGAEDEGKAALVVTVSKSLLGRFQAGNLIKEVAAKVNGSGGGRPDMAQAGGTHVAGLDDAVTAIYAAVENSAAG